MFNNNHVTIVHAVTGDTTRRVVRSMFPKGPRFLPEKSRRVQVNTWNLLSYIPLQRPKCQVQAITSCQRNPGLKPIREARFSKRLIASAQRRAQILLVSAL